VNTKAYVTGYKTVTLL